mgnify:CR=1 FL=1
MCIRDRAKEADIEKYYELYRTKGWDQIRKERHKRMADLGIIDSEIGFAEWENRQWEELSEAEKDHTAYRMAVYAAQVHCMDYNIGKLIESLKKSGKLDNTLIFFMSDNGACAEPHNELGGGKQKDINNPAVSGHPSYGKAWAQTSNTPFHSRSTSTATKAFSTISKLIESAKPVEVPRIRYAVYCISWPTDQPIPEITHPIILSLIHI